MDTKTPDEALDRAILLTRIEALEAENARLRRERRPFSDALAADVIDRQVKLIDALRAKLRHKSEPEAKPQQSHIDGGGQPDGAGPGP